MHLRTWHNKKKKKFPWSPYKSLTRLRETVENREYTETLFFHIATVL